MLGEVLLADFLNLDGFGSAFTQAFFMILATEIGDRTFFIAAIMAMRYPRFVIWSSAIAALILMTLISCVFGMTAIAFIPRVYVHWAVIGLMFFFGGQLLRNGSKMTGNEGFDELEEVEADIKLPSSVDPAEVDLEKQKGKIITKISSVALQAFTLTFLAEWGDRSQLATIALAAANAPLGVFFGGIIGHALCTGLAVIGGRLIANYVSEKTVTLGGGTLFIAFGLYAALMGIGE